MCYHHHSPIAKGSEGQRDDGQRLETHPRLEPQVFFFFMN